jgi:hypothetical protein
LDDLQFEFNVVVTMQCASDAGVSEVSSDLKILTMEIGPVQNSFKS